MSACGEAWAPISSYHPSQSVNITWTTACAAGKNVTLLPTPKTTRGTGLSDKTRLCESRTLNVTLQFGPYNNKTCGTNSQVRNALAYWCAGAVETLFSNPTWHAPQQWRNVEHAQLLLWAASLSIYICVEGSVVASHCQLLSM
jgi:hypothetical protein